MSVVWVLLPSTSVVVQFLSTRHYLEGMLFSALALCLLQHGARIGALMAMATGMLCKETYAVLIPAIVLLYAWRLRDRGLALSTAAIVCVYAVYRYWMLGPALSYDMPLLTLGQYLKFLSKLPYSLSSNYGGYGLCGAIAGLSYYFARRSRDNLRTILFFLATLALSLGPIFPASWPLYGTIRSPDPWYRILFLLNTVVILFGGYVAVRSLSRRMQLALAILAFAIMIPGAEKTRRLWAEMTASAEREGNFYLNNPDKTLLSEQVAWWFIPGVDQMYQVKTPHYVLLKDLSDIHWERRYGGGETADSFPKYGDSECGIRPTSGYKSAVDPARPRFITVLCLRMRARFATRCRSSQIRKFGAISLPARRWRDSGIFTAVRRHKTTKGAALVRRETTPAKFGPRRRRTTAATACGTAY